MSTPRVDALRSFRESGNIGLKTTKNVRWTAGLGKQTHATPVAANGVLYLATYRHLYAIAGDAKPE